jgi:hypothetical protein
MGLFYQSDIKNQWMVAGVGPGAGSIFPVAGVVPWAE